MTTTKTDCFDIGLVMIVNSLTRITLALLACLSSLLLLCFLLIAERLALWQAPFVSINLDCVRLQAAVQAHWDRRANAYFSVIIGAQFGLGRGRVHHG